MIFYYKSKHSTYKKKNDEIDEKQKVSAQIGLRSPFWLALIDIFAYALIPAPQGVAHILIYTSNVHVIRIPYTSRNSSAGRA